MARAEELFILLGQAQRAVSYYATGGYFKVQAVNSPYGVWNNGYMSILPPGDLTPPATPDPPGVGSVGGDTSVAVGGTIPPDVDRIRFKRRLLPGAEKIIMATTVAPAGDIWLDTDTQAGVTYYYSVSFLDKASNESEDSAEVSYTPS